MPRFDLDAIASEARAGFEPFVMVVGGEEFTLPAPTDLEWKHRLLLMRDGEAGLKAIWGDKEYRRFVRARPNGFAFDKAALAYGEYLGSSPGEPSGSTGS